MWAGEEEDKQFVSGTRMRLIPSFVGVVLVALFGIVQATPGILDLFNFETKFGPPPVRTVYGKSKDFFLD